MAESKGEYLTVEYPSGTKHWYFNKLFHRLDGPAIENSNGTREWYINGKQHRLDGPAIETLSGTKEWWLDGKRHRTSGPAIEDSNRPKYWYLNGKLHRLDGPAIEYPNGAKYWYLNGKKSKQSECFALVNIRKFRSRITIFNNALEFNLMKTLQLSRNKAVVEWYYSPDQGGGKLAKDKLARFVESKL